MGRSSFGLWEQCHQTVGQDLMTVDVGMVDVVFHQGDAKGCSVARVDRNEVILRRTRSGLGGQQPVMNGSRKSRANSIFSSI
jgi:hypothetical protein